MTLNITLEMPHTVFVIVARDSRGYKRGFEKVVGGRIHMTYWQAVAALSDMPPDTKGLYTIAEAVIGYSIQEAK